MVHRHLRAARRALCIYFLAILASAAVVRDARAQTLTEPAPHAQRTAKALPAAKTRSCAQYGAGFVPVAGTDLCIKLGGYVTTEGTERR
jgi:hypothetical protein